MIVLRHKVSASRNAMDISDILSYILSEDRRPLIANHPLTITFLSLSKKTRRVVQDALGHVRTTDDPSGAVKSVQVLLQTERITISTRK